NARLCSELGADIVKVNWSGDQRSFGEIVRAADAPVVVAGGTVVSDAELLARMEQAREVGAIGCSVGRNIFQHEHPEAMTRALALRAGTDYVFTYYRDMAVGLALGLTAEDIFLSVMARATDQFSGGRQLPNHLSSTRLRIPTASSSVGTQIVHAAGAAYAAR